MGTLQSLRDWWDELLSRGKDYGYYANPYKSWLIVKPEVLTNAKSMFDGTNVQITSNGHRYLGSPIGSSAFIGGFIQGKIQEWVSQLNKLTTIARSQPYAA